MRPATGFRGRFLAAVLLLLAPGGLWAQLPVFRPAAFAWGRVTAYVYGDSAAGVEVWLSVGQVEDGSLAPGFRIARFSPADVEAWTAAAESLLAPAPAGDTVSWIHPAMLVSADGKALVLGRRRIRRGWDPHANLLYIPPPGATGGQAFSVPLDTSAARPFLDSLRARARLTVVPPEYAAVLDSVPGIEKPELLSAPAPRFPESLRRRCIQGVVILVMRVDTLGRAEPVTMITLLATDSAFARVSRDALAKARFNPARVGGRPVPVYVQIPVNFRLHH